MNRKLARIVYAIWIYTLLVILWGAWVRISHSGNGCGDHWPLCQGEILPSLSDRRTWVEFSHRLMSGLYGFLVIALFFYTKAMVKKNAGVSPMTGRLSSLLVVFMILEALLGALLVKQNLVTVNDSIMRLVVMSLHQLNSFLLTGVTFLLYVSLEKQVSVRWTRLNITVLVVAVSGAMAALATTLFPATSVWEGILQDLSRHSHLFIRLRILHPLLAVTAMGYVIFWLRRRDENILALKFFLAVLVGFITLVSLSPVWLKLTHLVLAHYLWAEVLRYQLVRKPEAM